MAYEILTYTTPITSYKGSTGSNYSNTNVPIGKTSGYSNYASVIAPTTKGSSRDLYYAFDCSSLPKNASIVAIECDVGYGIQFSSGEAQYYDVTASLQADYKELESKTLNDEVSLGARTFLFGKCYRSYASDLRVRVKIACKEKRTTTQTLRLYYATVKVHYILTDELSDVVLEEMNIHAIKGSSIATAHDWDACVYVNGAWRYVREAYVYHNGAWRTTATYEPKQDILYSWARYNLTGTSGLTIDWSSSTTTITMNANKKVVTSSGAQSTVSVKFGSESRFYLDGSILKLDGPYESSITEFGNSYTDPGVTGSGMILVTYSGAQDESFYKVLSYTKDKGYNSSVDDDTVTFVCAPVSSYNDSDYIYTKGSYTGEIVYSENPTEYPNDGHDYSSYYQNIKPNYSTV